MRRETPSICVVSRPRPGFLRVGVNTPSPWKLVLETTEDSRCLQIYRCPTHRYLVSMTSVLPIGMMGHLRRVTGLRERCGQCIMSADCMHTAM